MNKKLHVRSNDMVQVTTGEYRGVRGKVLEARPREDKVVVDGVNVVWKHIKPSREHPQGGRIEREAPIHASNVMLLCQNRECGRYDQPVRTRRHRDEEGNLDRVCVKCGHPIRASE